MLLRAFISTLYCCTHTYTSSCTFTRRRHNQLRWTKLKENGCSTCVLVCAIAAIEMRMKRWRNPKICSKNRSIYDCVALKKFLRFFFSRLLLLSISFCAGSICHCFNSRFDSKFSIVSNARQFSCFLHSFFCSLYSELLLCISWAFYSMLNLSWAPTKKRNEQKYWRKSILCVWPRNVFVVIVLCAKRMWMWITHVWYLKWH